MKITKKSELIVERERCVTIKIGGTSGEKFCADCGKNTQFVTTDEAAVILRTTVRELFRLIENEQFHFIETESGSMLICLTNLSETGGQILRITNSGK